MQNIAQYFIIVAGNKFFVLQHLEVFEGLVGRTSNYGLKKGKYLKREDSC